MTIGYPNLNWKAGVVAACMSLVGILGAKFMIFLAVVMAVTTGDTNDHEFQLAFVNSMLTEDILNDRGLEDEKEREAQWESAYNEAEAQTAKMGRNEVRQRWKFYRDRLEAEAAEEPFADHDPVNEASESAVSDEGSGVASAFFETMFSPYDVLFVLLAIVTAYRLASGRSGELESP